MTSAKEHADEAGQRVSDAMMCEWDAGGAKRASALVRDAQQARWNWIRALISLLDFLNALPEPIAIPPVPQPSEEARRRGLLVGAVVRDADGNIGRVVSHSLISGQPLVQWRVNMGIEETRLTVIRPAPTPREPNAEAVRRGLYIGARVALDGFVGEIIAWDGLGNPVVDPDDDLEPIGSWLPESVTLAGDAS